MNVFIVLRTFFDSNLCDYRTVILTCFRHKKSADRFCAILNKLYGEEYSVICNNMIDYDWKK